MITKTPKSIIIIFIAAQCPRTTFIPPPSLLFESGRRNNRNKGAYRETCSLPQESSGTLSVESTAAALLPEEYNDNDMDCKYLQTFLNIL